jgi:tetratricopeptide (TPR) repeat protein
VSIFVRVMLLPLVFVVASCATRNTDPGRYEMSQYGGDAMTTLDPARKISVQDCTKSFPMDGGNLLCAKDPATIETINETDEALRNFSEKNWDAAIASATMAINTVPNNVPAYVTRSGAYANVGRLPEALADSETAIRLDHNFGMAYNNRGYVYELMRNSFQASSDYETACRLKVELGCVNLKRMRQ